MKTLIGIIIVGVIIYFIVKSSKAKATKQKAIEQQRLAEFELPVEIKVTTSSDVSDYREGKFKPIEQDKEGNWILNPGAPFKLTLLNADESITQKVRSILDDYKIYRDKKIDKISAIFSEYNLKIKEVEKYIIKYKKNYLTKIEELKNASEEWETSYEKDREDILEDFRKIAMQDIYEKAQCDLRVLFENEPKDITIDDELIKEYGFETMQTYMRYADNMDKVRVIPKDHYLRHKFDKLAELNLAVRGNYLSKKEILSTLTLKALNVIANKPDKQFRRKNQAIEYIVSLENLDEIIGKNIALRELFKLKPLPEKYSSINLNEVAKTWNYTYQVVDLLINTFISSYYSYRDLEDREDVTGYRVEYSEYGDPCPCGKELASKKYPKNKPPKIPYHIGCNCSLIQEYDDL